MDKLSSSKSIFYIRFLIMTILNSFDSKSDQSNHGFLPVVAPTSSPKPGFILSEFVHIIDSLIFVPIHVVLVELHLLPR